MKITELKITENTLSKSIAADNESALRASHDSALIPTIDWNRVVGYRRAFFGNQLMNMARLGRAAGPIGRFDVLDTPVVIINAPSLVDEVVVKQSDYFGVVRKDGLLYRNLVKNGLPFRDGEFHRRQRKIIAPVFQAGKIARYAEAIASLADARQCAWKDGEVLDLVEEMKRLTMACHWRTFLGRDVTSPEDLLRDSFRMVMRCLEEKAQLSPLRRTLPSKGYAEKLGKAINTLSESVYDLIRQRRESLEPSFDVLSLLLQMQYEDGIGMSDAQLHDEILSMLLAGYETVASAITWTWHLMSQHPESLARLHQELDGVLAGRAPAYEDLPHLPYALQVIKETMRLYPTGGNVVRRALDDVRIGDYRLPKGTEVWILPYLMNRDPNAFPNPEYFNPDRFAPDVEKDVPRYAFMPFGGGVHYCIGHHLALVQNHLILATLAQRVRLEVMARPRVIPEMLTALVPKHGLRARVCRRAD